MDAIEGAFESDDLDSALGAISSSLTTFKMNAPVYNASMNGAEVFELQEINEKLTEMKESMTNNVLAMVDNVVDESTQEDVISALSDMTEGGTQFTDATKAKVTTSVSDLITNQVTGGAQRRKRRSTDDEESVTGKTPQQCETAMGTSDNTIEPMVMTPASMSLKKTFTDLTPVLATGMCQQLTFGQPSVIAKGSLASIKSVMQVFANVSSTSIDLNCDVVNCSSAKLQLGSSLVNKYSSFDCGDADNCTGACIGSVNYNYDLFDNDVSRVIITDVMAISLIDPQQYSILAPGTLEDPVQLQLPLRDEKYTSN